MNNNKVDYSAITNSKLFKESVSEEFDLKLSTEGFDTTNFWLSVFRRIVQALANPANFFKGFVTEIDKIFQQFATDNKYSYKSIGKTFHSPKDTLPNEGLVFTNENWRLSVYNKLEGEFSGMPFTYYIGSFFSKKFFNGKDNPPSLTTALQINLKVSVPMLYIGLKQQHEFEAEKIFSDGKLFEERILEGNFEYFYKVYAEKNDHLTAHYILSPEVMDLLLKNKMFDIWIDGSHLVIFTNVPTYQIYLQYIQDYFKFMEILIKNIDVVQKNTNITD